MLFELIFLLVLGMLFVILGLLIWKKEKIGLIHSYHHKKVAEADKKAYANMMGKGVVLIGCGMLMTGIIDFYTKSGLGWTAFGICFVIGLGIFIYAGSKYNR